MSSRGGAHPLTADAILHFQTTLGSQLLSRVGDLYEGGRSSLQIQQQLSDIDAARLRAALYLWDQRLRGREKFGALAHTLFMDDDGQQMASSPMVARHRARRFDQRPVADLCCGIGGDLIALAERGPCVGVDINRPRLHMAHANTRSFSHVEIVEGDACHPPVRVDAAVIDPARRPSGGPGRRVTSGQDYEPGLQHLETWRQRFDLLAVKISPALDLAQIPVREEVEYVSWQGQCREAVLWYGLDPDCRRRASLLDEAAPGGSHTLYSSSDQVLRPSVAPVGACIYDPDPAVVRSHLVGELAQGLDAWLIADDVAYLSAHTPTRTPWARTLTVLEQIPFQLKRLQQHLRKNSWRPGAIRRRHFPVEPEVLRQRLGRFDAKAERVDLVCTRIGGKTTVFICAPVV